MCGVAGIFHIEGMTSSSDEDAVRRMNAAQVHRGPDGEGCFRDDRIVLGHRRLSIIDLSPSGRQPMSNEDATVWVTFNGEIYNFQELVRDLSHHRFRSLCDSEVLLHGYEEWGIDGLLKRLRGMFAFALYDSRNSQSRCYLVRDRLGIKPIYYLARKGRLAFASEVKALVNSGIAPDDKDMRALVGLMLFGSVPSPRTMVRGVQCLMPGFYLAADRTGVSLCRYWSMDESGESADASEEVEQELGPILQESVKLHMISDVPVGVYLSGGVDSAALVALASRIGSKLVTLTVSFDEEEFSEAEAAGRIARKFGADHRPVHLTNQDFMRDVRNVISAMDQPTTDGVNSYFVAHAAKQAGLTVALSGLGGDELFGGYRHHRWLARRSRSIQLLSRLPAWSRRAIVRAGVLYGGLRGRENWMRLAGLIEAVGGPELYLLQRGFFAPHQICSLLGIDERELGLATQEFLEPLSPEKTADIAPSQVFRQIEFKRYLHDQLLRDTDVFSMAHSVEVRVPFLDHVVMEHVAKLPKCLEFQGPGTKPVLTRAVNEESVFEAGLRPKKGFSFPFRKWMKIHSPDLKEMAMAGGCLDRHEVGRLWQEFENDRLHWSRAWMLSVVGAGK